MKTKATNTYLVNQYNFAMKHISPARFNLVVDSIFHNCQRVSVDRKSIAQLAKDCSTSINSVIAIRNLLSEEKLLIIEGERRNQTITWHPGKAQPNPTMLTKLYELHTRFNGRVKVNERKPGRISLELALRTLVQLGYTGVISKSKHSGYSIITESIDLSKVEVEE